MSHDSGSEGFDDAQVEVEEHGVRVKIENTVSTWVPPLYAEEPTLVFDGKLPVSRKTFESVYGLPNRGKSPKKLKIGRDCTEAEVERWFGPVNGKNAYHYNHFDDEETCKEIERIWMICHQKTVVPGIRCINKAEARGFTCMKKDPPVLVNWAVFGEWCIRDRIRREERLRKKQSLGLGSLSAVTTTVQLDSDTSDEENPRNVKCGVEVKREFSEKRKRLADMPPSYGRSDQDTANLILEWSNYVSALDEEVFSISSTLQVLKQNKERTASELLCAHAQLSDRQQLLRTASAKLQQLEAEMNVMKASMPENSEVQFENLPGAGPLMRKLDAQSGVIDTFTEMLADGEVEHKKAIEKATFAFSAENDALEGFEVLVQQRQALKDQLRVFRTGHHLEVPLPRPRQLGNHDSTLHGVQDCCVISHPCAFCGKSFEPEWDCKIASCKHGYHSWCANAHFSTSRKCCFKNCGQEMHSSWWIQSGYEERKSRQSKRASSISNEGGEFQNPNLTESLCFSTCDAMSFYGEVLQFALYHILWSLGCSVSFALDICH